MNVLSEALRMYCSVRRISTRDLGKVWGCSHTTAARFLSGKPVDMRTFVKIMGWATEEMQGHPNPVTNIREEESS